MENDIREAFKEKGVVIMGDFNYPHIDWINVCSNHTKEVKILGTLNDYALEQLVMAGGEANLDLILSGLSQNPV